MANEKLIFTTSDGTDIPLVMALAGHGAGVSFIIPSLLTWQESKAVTDLMTEPRNQQGEPGGHGVGLVIPDFLLFEDSQQDPKAEC